MGIWQKLAFAAAWTATLCLSTGCTSVMGSFVPNSQFAYQNSNVRPLAPVRAEITRWSFFVPRTLTCAEIRGVYHEALSKAADANILINYKEDTRVTIYPFFIPGVFFVFPLAYRVHYSLEGEAARMEVGRKPLQ